MVLLVNKVFLGVYGNADGILCQSVSAVKQKTKLNAFPMHKECKVMLLQLYTKKNVTLLVKLRESVLRQFRWKITSVLKSWLSGIVIP